MITVSKAEAKMIREKFPRAHMVTTVHKTMVDETRDVLKALGLKAPESDFAAMEMLQAETGMPAPESLACLKNKPERFDTVIDPAEIADVALGKKS